MTTVVKAKAPMLAATLSTLAEVRFPAWASPKLDGLRGSVQGGKALTRSLKLVPNMAARAFLERIPALEGLDGELMVHGMDLHALESVFMTRNAKLPEQWYFGVFDVMPKTASEIYRARYERALAAVSAASAMTGTHVLMVPQLEVHSVDDVLKFESRVLEMGFEGVVLRRPASKYKHGRSTLSDGALMKWKRFADAEAEIIGFEPSDTLPGALGAFVVRDLLTGVVFKVGTGPTHAQRLEFWRKKASLLGRIVKYKHYPTSGGKPPSAVLLGFRSRDDM